MKYFVKRLKYVLTIPFFFLLVACSNKKSCINEYDMTYNNSFSPKVEIMPEETCEFVTPEPTETKKIPITEDWIETKEEYEATRYKSNGKLDVSVLRESKSITNEKGAVLANIYYDKPVVSGDSEVARKVNQFFEKEKQEWFDGGGRNTLYNANNYTIFYEQFCDLYEALGEDRLIEQPPCYTISTRIAYFDLDILSVVQVAHFFTGHNYHYYFGSTFDMKSGEPVPIDELAANINADTLKQIIENVLPGDEIYDEIGGNNYVIHYYDDEVVMNYEYFYDGKSFYIILNRNRRLEDGLIIEWNGKWGEDYEAESFQYWEQQGSEMWQKEK